MLLITHLSSGYILNHYLSDKFGWINKKKTLVLFLISVIIPDIDGFFGANINNHRKTIFHAPLIYLFLLTIIFIWGTVRKNKTFKTFSLIFLCGSFVHFFLDWASSRTTGVWIFYPFSEKLYHLFPINSDIGNISLFPSKENSREYLNFIRFSLENKTVVFLELFILFWGITLFIFNKRKNKIVNSHSSKSIIL